jgi:hypothetical protein
MELEKHFPMQELLNTTKRTYINIWLVLEVELLFSAHGHSRGTL